MWSSRRAVALASAALVLAACTDAEPSAEPSADSSSTPTTTLVAVPRQSVAHDAHDRLRTDHRATAEPGRG